MRRIKEVLRLRFELGLGQREIARACAISQGGHSERWLSRRLNADSADEER
jgi:DNA-directed RNA polymerase specialized sigma subunit